MITFDCKDCGLITKENVYMVDNNGDIGCHCKNCHNMVLPSKDILQDRSKDDELSQVVTELAKELNEKEVLAALQNLVAEGLVEIVGIDGGGNEFYSLSDKCKQQMKEKS